MTERITPRDITLSLWKIGAISITEEQKTLASGRKSHLYFNVGDYVISFPDEKEMVVTALEQTFWSLMYSYRSLKDPDVRLLGVPQGADCLVSSLSDRLEMGQLRVREKIEKHGEQKSIEGFFEKGMRVVIVEDVKTSGQSLIKRAATPAIEAGLRPAGAISLIDRGTEAAAFINKIPFSYFTAEFEMSQILLKGVRLSPLERKYLRESWE